MGNIYKTFFVKGGRAHRSPGASHRSQKHMIKGSLVGVVYLNYQKLFS